MSHHLPPVQAEGVGEVHEVGLSQLGLPQAGLSTRALTDQIKDFSKTNLERSVRPAKATRKRTTQPAGRPLLELWGFAALRIALAGGALQIHALCLDVVSELILHKFAVAH